MSSNSDHIPTDRMPLDTDHSNKLQRRFDAALIADDRDDQEAFARVLVSLLLSESELDITAAVMSQQIDDADDLERFGLALVSKARQQQAETGGQS